jgi:hypothetical protein
MPYLRELSKCDASARKRCKIGIGNKPLRSYHYLETDVVIYRVYV